ncbi:HpcH/HpaI aldolase/citrate lyase family protein [Haladaptatus pallidirubidus]|uniref:HpcH/HpaI aldolase family protein n=1 Tax=Haladaptatus pallidirubidus TaxID=1008152 RepID=UPI0035EC450E
MSELRQAVRAGDSVVGTWVTIGHPAVAEMSAELGFDFVVLDAEHSSMSLETVENLARAVDAASGETKPVVRLPDDDPTRIKRVLDTGVSGVIVPMIETAEQARAVVRATRYPPEGERGVAGSRAAKYGLELEEYFERANDELLVMVQIESAKGVGHAGSIAAVDGVDALFVGPADLSASIGRFGETDSSTPRFPLFWTPSENPTPRSEPSHSTRQTWRNGLKSASTFRSSASTLTI